MTRRARSLAFVGLLALAAFVASQAVSGATARAQDAAPAASSDTADACFSAAERAQPLLRQRRLREARALLEFCARDACPRVARTDCREWLAEATDAQPSIIISPYEVHGKGQPRHLADVRAVIDDSLVVDRVDGMPVVIDPGRHRLRLERAGAEPLVLEIDVRDGEKNRVVDAYWRQPEAVSVARPVSQGIYVAAAIGALATGVGAYFEIAGLGDRSNLYRCQPTCPQSQLNSARTETAVGDVTLGVGLVLVAGAVIYYLARPTVEVTGDGSARARTEEGATWMFGATPNGVFAGVRGSL